VVANPLAWTGRNGNISQHVAEESVRFLLKHIGEDPARDGLTDTPRRVTKALLEMTTGYQVDVPLLLSVQFDQDATPYHGIVVLRRVPFASLCEHHLLPFVGTADVAYIPGNGRIVGLSKLARLVDAYAKRLQVQERMTVQIVEALEEHLRPDGSACIIRADHTCMSLRGIEKQAGGMVTSEVRGNFMDDPRARLELMELLNAPRD
jgi:GTP cyclohydrolase IA